MVAVERAPSKAFAKKAVSFRVVGPQLVSRWIGDDPRIIWVADSRRSGFWRGRNRVFSGPEPIGVCVLMVGEISLMVIFGLHFRFRNVFVGGSMLRMSVVAWWCKFYIKSR